MDWKILDCGKNSVPLNEKSEKYDLQRNIYIAP